MTSHRRENRNCHSQQKALRAALRIKSVSLPWPSGPAVVLALPAVTSRDAAPLLLPFRFGKLGLHVTDCLLLLLQVSALQKSHPSHPFQPGLLTHHSSVLFSSKPCLTLSEGFFFFFFFFCLKVSRGVFVCLRVFFSKHIFWASPVGQDSALLFAVSLALVWSLANSRCSTDTESHSELIRKDRSENACSTFQKGKLLP